MRRTILLTLALFAATSCAKPGVAYRVVPAVTPDGCTWVVRQWQVVTPEALSTPTGADEYLYLCCPTPDGPPECLTPKWEEASNHRRLLDP